MLQGTWGIIKQLPEYKNNLRLEARNIYGRRQVSNLVLNENAILMAVNTPFRRCNLYINVIEGKASYNDYLACFIESIMLLAAVIFIF